MNKKSRSIFTLVMVFAIIAVFFMMGTGLAFADEATAEAAQGFDSSEAISRQPEAEGKIRSTFMLGLVFIETAIIYALLVVILIIFVI